MNLYSIYDEKIKSYMKPFLVEKNGHAVRGFQSMVNDPSTNLNKYPEDFTLFHIGYFDEETGKIDGLKDYVNLGNAASFKDGEK